MNQIPLKTEVLIIGAGPVGLILANVLKRNGINVILIDKRSSKSSSPRSIAINQATLDIFETLGLKNIINSGLLVENIHLYCQQKYLGQLNFKDKTLEHPYFFHITQNDVEKCLENDVQKLGLKIHRGAELIDYTQNESSTVAQISENGKLFTVQAHFLIGCDGGHSRVREIMGCGIDHREYGTSFVLADVVLKNYSTKDTRYIFARQGYLMIVPLPEKKYRLIFSFKSEPYLSDKTTLQELINERSGNSIEILSVLWSTHSKFGHKISNQTVQNRVVLAGDALHQFSPVGGTNMNVGIQDAFALGWRLVHAINASSHITSLSEYALEREDIIQRQQFLTEWITALITRSKNYPLLDNYSLSKNLQNISGYLTGLIGANKKEHFQNCINYQEIKNHVQSIRYAFSKAKYVLFTQGSLITEVLEEIESKVQDKPFLTWIHDSEKEPSKFLLCRPDATMILSGDPQNIDQIFNILI